MSIASEITRLQNAKSNLKNKLEIKGVLVGNERLDEMVNLVENIETGTDTTDATATSSDITLGATAYVKGEKVIGTNELSRLQAEGGISYNGGLYVNETLQGLIELNAPNKINVMVPNVEVRVEYGGKVKSPNLEPQNIAKDVNILGVVGTFEGGSSGTDTTDATATASDILLGKTAYVNDEKIEGTIETYDGASEGGKAVVEGTPIELSTSAEMEAVLVAENIGKIYKYVGETNETFTNGNLYQVMEVDE